MEKVQVNAQGSELGEEVLPEMIKCICDKCGEEIRPWKDYDSNDMVQYTQVDIRNIMSRGTTTGKVNTMQLCPSCRFDLLHWVGRKGT